MTIAIWPDGKSHTLQRVEFVFISEDGETVRRTLTGHWAEHLYGQASNAIARRLRREKIAKGNIEVVK
ncbi:hypothetical protein LCGC14_1447500 [marine sediment metagenome]|uniref:Uncharacterized protein n=1 Tax=marine sediment metagenome TaxID=412755 RepID=A0A0F9JIR7_9ZZZZ